MERSRDTDIAQDPLKKYSENEKTTENCRMSEPERPEIAGGLAPPFYRRLQCRE